MSHADDAHGLRVQLTVALKERDEAEAALRISNSLNGHRSQRIEELEAQRERLETAARAYIDGHELALTRAENAESERDTLRAALQKHGCHEVECGANKEEDDQFCTCGLTAALAGGGDRG